jgi:hypothetical protein
MRKGSAPEIPLEAECTACADAQFKVGYDIRGMFHVPTRSGYLSHLEHLFDLHMMQVHPKATQWAFERPRDRWIDDLRKAAQNTL